MSDELRRLRLDKWLWAARFFKTRSIASAAIDGGKIRVNGLSCKPAKEICVGDVLDITAGEQLWQVEVRRLNAQRRPAVEARELYEETSEGQSKRLAMQEMRRLAPPPGAELRGRPTKRDGRKLREWQG